MNNHNICRWSVACIEPAAADIAHGTAGGISACATYAADWLAWYQSNLPNAPEPAPECWCPPQLVAAGQAVDFCPTHGSPSKRGLDSRVAIAIRHASIRRR